MRIRLRQKPATRSLQLQYPTTKTQADLQGKSCNERCVFRPKLCLSAYEHQYLMPSVCKLFDNAIVHLQPSMQASMQFISIDYNQGIALYELVLILVGRSYRIAKIFCSSIPAQELACSIASSDYRWNFCIAQEY